jgi:hypothetical protein
MTTATSTRPKASSSSSVARKVNKAAHDAVKFAKEKAAEALSFVKALARKAVAFMRQHGTLIGLASAAVMATKKGYHGVIGGIRWALDKARQGITLAAHAVNAGAFWIGSRVGKLIGKIHAGAGQAFTNTLVDINCFTCDTINMVDTVAARFIAQINAAAVSGMVTKIVNWTSTVVLGGIVANILFSGAVANLLAGIPYVGAAAASIIAGGPVTMLALLGAAGILAAYVYLFDFGQVKDAHIDEMDEDSRKAFEEAETIKAAGKKEAAKAYADAVAAASA